MRCGCIQPEQLHLLQGLVFDGLRPMDLRGDWGGNGRIEDVLDSSSLHCPGVREVVPAMRTYRLAALAGGAPAILATVVHWLVLLDLKTSFATEVSRVLLWLFGASCVSTLFSNVQTSDLRSLYAAPVRRIALAVLLVLCFIYGIGYAVLSLGSSLNWLHADEK